MKWKAATVASEAALGHAGTVGRKGAKLVGNDVGACGAYDDVEGFVRRLRERSADQVQGVTGETSGHASSGRGEGRGSAGGRGGACGVAAGERRRTAALEAAMAAQKG